MTIKDNRQDGIPPSFPLDMARTMFVVIDKNGKVSYINKMGCEILRYEKKQILGRDWFDQVIPKKIRSEARSLFKKSMTRATEQAGYHEIPVQTGDGQEIIIAWHHTLLRDETDRVAGMLSSGEDITQRKRSEKELQESEARFHAIFNNTNDALFLHRIHADGMPGSFVEVNDVACRQLGYTRQELLTLTPMDIAAPGSGTDYRTVIKNLKNSRQVTFEDVYRSKKGILIPVEISSHLFMLGSHIHVLSVARDITERKVSEKQIRHLNTVLRAIRNINQLITQEKDRVCLLQRSCEELTGNRGYSSAWIALVDSNHHIVTLAKSGDIAGFKDLIRQMEQGHFNTCTRLAMSRPGAVVIDHPETKCRDCPMLGREPTHRSITIRLSRGERIYGVLSVSAAVLLSVNQEEQNLLEEVAGDIAFALYNMELDEERRHTKNALEENERFLNAVFHSIQDGISVLDPDLTIRHTNSKMKEWYAENVPLEGKKCYACYQNLKSPCDPCPSLRCLKTGNTEFEVVPGLPGSPVEWIELFSYPIMDSNTNKVSGVVEFVRDITERKKYEQALLQNLKEKEVMLKEIHHRVKNNLTIINSLLNLQSYRIHSKEQALQAFAESKNRIRSMALVHENLYRSDDFSQIHFDDYTKRMTSELIKIYDKKHHVSIKYHIDNILLDINTAIPCGLMLNELVTNALKHAFRSSKKGQIRISFHAEKNNQYLLSVSDNGTGMPENFNIEKSESLGLQLIQILTNQLDGTLTITGRNGTQFDIRFPITQTG